jgi:hypothetical protein
MEAPTMEAMAAWTKDGTRQHADALSQLRWRDEFGGVLDRA